MKESTIAKNLMVVPGSLRDYEKLSRFHYRRGRLGPVSAVYALKPRPGSLFGQIDTAGVIVYTMPTACLELRNRAMGHLLCGLDYSSRIQIINHNIRCISRVIIEPRFRGMHLAVKLVKATLEKINIPVVEAMAVMGRVNPFFAKAGMNPIKAPQPARTVRLEQAFSMVGIERNDLLDGCIVHKRLEKLPAGERDFIETEMTTFLQAYKKHRNSRSTPERTDYILSKLTARPIYYIWFNPKQKFSFDIDS